MLSLAPTMSVPLSEPTSHERDLVDAAQQGDGLAFRRLVEPHLPMLLRIAARRSQDPALAEDAVQETLALAYQRLGEYRPERSFKAYLAAVATKQAFTLARGERRRKHREDASAEPSRLAGPEEELRGARAADRVREALATLPEKRRRAALLRLDAGLSYKEIAEALDSTEGSARVLVHKAQAQLREALADLLDQGATS